MSGARAYGAFAQIGGKHLVVNGENDGGLFLETGEIFDGSAWSPLQDYPDNRELSCGARISDTAWMVSGGTGNNPKAVHSYDVDAGEWMEQPEMTLARFDHGCMAYTKDGKICKTATTSLDLRGSVCESTS